MLKYNINSEGLMNILQVIYIIIATYFFSFGIFYLAQVIFIFKKYDKHFHFALAALFGTIYILCTAALSTSQFFDYALIIHRIKFAALLFASTFWIYSTFDIFFSNSKIPLFFGIYSSIWTIPTLFSTHFFSEPIKILSFKLFNSTMIYLHGTTGILYKLCVPGILIIFTITAVKIIYLNVPLKKKITGLLIVSPAIVGGIHDSLVLNGHLDNPLILEFLIFIFLIATFTMFFSEQKKKHLRIENINKELEDKVDDKTRQLSNATAQMWKNYRQLKQANKVKQEVLQIAAHDMKSPLQAIVGYSELLMIQFSDNKVLCKRLNKILKSADMMLKIIENLLEQEADNIEQNFLNIAECNVSTITEYVVDRNYANAIKKRQKLLINTENNCIIKSDNDKILEIVDNLVSNAIKYTDFQGEIIVSTKKENEKIIVSVKDSGPGFNENDKQLLYKKFTRLSPQPTGDEKSTGLGLYIVKKFVDLLNGEIKVISELGKGSEFVIGLDSIQE